MQHYHTIVASEGASIVGWGWQGGTHQRDSGMAGLVTSVWGRCSSWWHGQAGA